jgi:MoxR-like ATPase
MTSPNTANILSAVNDIIVGKHQTSRLALTCLLAQGHLLIEDLPGVGKTTLAHTLAKVLGLDFQRLQFTSDMLPADILGVSIFDRDAQQFHFHPGPIFSQLVLADEVNRATPRTQSALLEAMEERQITIEGETHPLPTPFFVIATQNPSHQIGTFPLPESQLDRFLMRLAMGYPDAESERQLLSGTSRQLLLQQLNAIIDPVALTGLQHDVSQVHTSPALVDYVQKILAFSRESGLYIHGLSPRAGLGLIRAAQAWAFIEGRPQALPEDIQAILPAVANHRLQARDGDAQHDFSASLIAQVPIP